MSNKRQFILVTGGRRSGKSSHALELAESLGKRRLYIATADALDDEMVERIARHRKERGEDWNTTEEPMDISSIIEEANAYNVILVDCLTLWLCNIMHKDIPYPSMGEGKGEGEMDAPLTSIPSHEERGGKMESCVPDDEYILARVDALTHACRENKTIVIAVTNELGSGVIPDNALSRRFTDLAGIMNQRMAHVADKVILTVSGIPMTIKGGE